MKRLAQLFVNLLIGIFVLMSLYISLYDIWLLIQKATRIESYRWFLGQLPGLFAVVYLLNQWKKTKVLRKLTTILGILTFIVLIYTISITDYIQLEYLLVAIFALTVVLKILLKDLRTKTSNVEKS